MTHHTYAGHTHEQAVIDKIRRNGGFTDWWISENQWRIAAFEKLMSKGIIVSDGGEYPFARFKLCLK